MAKQISMTWILKKLLRCPADTDLITVWRRVEMECGLGQTHTVTKIYLGRYVVLRWATIHTPLIGSDH